MKDNKTRALMHVFGKVLGPTMRIVDVKPSENEWLGYKTYMVRYEYSFEPGEYNTLEFLPSPKTEKEVNDALEELEYQAAGKEFPE